MSTRPTQAFFGREAEIGWLIDHFEAVARRDADGHFAGPRSAVVLAESGFGKSRLVQELYVRLAEDPRWDPPETDYWPAAFGDGGINLAVVPDMRGHVPKGPPRFVWLGARWHCPDDRNALERRSALPDLRSSVMVHAEVLRSHGPTWSEVFRRSLQVGRDEGLDVAADMVGIPFFGLASKLAKNVKEMVTDRRDGPKRFQDVEAKEINTEVEDVLDVMRELLDGRSTLPTVLWLDDAQWIDPESLLFLSRLLSEAKRRRWPLLVVVTHWEREWRELVRQDRTDGARGTLRALVDQEGGEVLHLRQAENGALDGYLTSRLPGLTAGQRQLLLQKAAGNFLTMVENVGELLSEPMWFDNEDTSQALTADAVTHIQKFETGREKRVQQRFQTLEAEARKILGWSTQIGPRFLAVVIEDFARERLKPVDVAMLLDRCVDPYVVLGKPSPLQREFRDKVFHQVANAYREKFLRADSERLSVELQHHLIEWVNNSFDETGSVICPDSERGIVPPPRSVMALPEVERRDLLLLARRELPLPSTRTREKALDVASLKARYLGIITASIGNFRLATDEYLASLQFCGPDTLAEVPSGHLATLIGFTDDRGALVIPCDLLLQRPAEWDAIFKEFPLDGRGATWVFASRWAADALGTDIESGRRKWVQMRDIAIRAEHPLFLPAAYAFKYVALNKPHWLAADMIEPLCLGGTYSRLVATNLLLQLALRKSAFLAEVVWDEFWHPVWSYTENEIGLLRAAMAWRGMPTDRPAKEVTIKWFERLESERVALLGSTAIAPETRAALDFFWDAGIDLDHCSTLLQSLDASQSAESTLSLYLQSPLFEAAEVAAGTCISRSRGDVEALGRYSDLADPASEASWGYFIVAIRLAAMQDEASDFLTLIERYSVSESAQFRGLAAMQFAAFLRESSAKTRSDILIERQKLVQRLLHDEDIWPVQEIFHVLQEYDNQIAEMGLDWVECYDLRSAPIVGPILEQKGRFCDFQTFEAFATSIRRSPAG
jgi:hypothetical protein